jgi:quinol monooxygenase YgiN
MIIVTGSVTARPDSFDALKQACLAHVARSRAEEGCISHAVHVDAEDPLRLFFYERWTDMAALKAHFVQPGTATFLAAVRELAAASEAPAIFEAVPPDRT